MGPLIELAAVRVSLARRLVLSDITWSLNPHEHWLVTGPNGAGKSTLLRAIAGEQWVEHGIGSRRYRLVGDDDDIRRARSRIGYLSPELHERYLRMELPLSVREMLLGGLTRTFYLDEPPSLAQERRLAEVAAALEIVPLLREPMNGLSFGQFRRALLGRALIADPKVLVLDEFSHGLDAASRGAIGAALADAAGRGTSLIVATHRTTQIPPAITHELRIERGRIVRQGPYRAAASKGTRSTAQFPQARNGAPILRLRGVDVFIDGDVRLALRGIDWEVRAGEHWIVSGPNGAGKTTLAKLLYGRLRAAHGGLVERFGSSANLSVAEIRRDVGLISDDEQLRYDWSIPVESVIVSGFFDSVGLFLREPGAEQRGVARRLAAEFGIEHLLERRFLELSFGERRMVLVARSLVRSPRLLVLDEALNGFDREARARIMSRVERMAAEGTSVVMIGHDDADAPGWISNRLRLENGRIAAVERG